MHPKKKVVVVDDNEINAKMLEEFLDGQGYQVALAYTAQEGLKQVTDTNPDIVILDLFLPDMKGSQVCVQLRARKATQHIPIILCTAHSISQSEKMKGFQSGVDDYLVRPFELSELSARMEALLRRASPHFQSEVLAGIDALLKIPPQPKPAPVMVATVEKAIDKPVPKKDAPSAVSPAQQPVSVSVPVPADFRSFQPLHRIIAILNHPSEAFAQAKQHEDLLVSLMLILGTPMIASVLSENHVGSVAWLSALGVKIGANLVAWFVMAGILHVAAPFLGKHWSLQRTLSITGLSWAPRALEAVLTVLYAFVAPAFVARVSGFSAGLTLLPGMNVGKADSLMSQVNIFSLWSVAILLMATWKLSGSEKKWNSITITIALIALLCGMVLHV